MEVRIRILGPLEVESDGRLLTVGGGRQRALLGRLALEAGRTVAAGRLIADVWGEDAPEAARKRLQVGVARLRRTLGESGEELLVTAADGYVLRLTDGQLDLHEFKQLVDAGRTALAAGDAPAAAATLARALALWRGPALDDVALGPAVGAQLAELEELRLSALEDGVQARLDLGQERRLVPELERLVRENPLRERLCAQLMVALYRTGRQADALEAYRRTRRLLAGELGLEPGPMLRELEQAVLDHDPSLRAQPPAPPRLRTRAPTAPALPGSRSRTRFVGRGGELEILRRSLRETEPGRCALVLLEGEAGIGKTRLATQFADECRADGALALYGHCDAETLTPYQPFVEALRPRIDDAVIERLARRSAAHAGELHRLLPEIGETTREDEAERFRLFDAVVTLLEELSRGRPAVLVLDDLHWADTPTLLMLRQVLRSPIDARMLVVAGLRRTEAGRPVRDILADLRRELVFERIELAGLGADDAAALMEGLSEAAIPEPVSRELWERSSGNPFFLEEIVRDRDANEAGEPMSVPAAVRDVILRRLARLPEELQKLLAIAGVAGSEFSLDVLEDVSGLDDDAIEPLLDAAVEAHVIVERPGTYGEFTFEHSLIRHTVVTGLTNTRRARLHLRVAESLEARATDGDGRRLAELAHHYMHGPPDRGLAKGVEFAVRAGRHALDMLAYEEAARQFELAVAALDRIDGDARRRLDTLLLLGEAQAKAGHAQAARETFLRAGELGRANRWPEGLARAALGFGFFGQMSSGVVDEAMVALLEEALAALGDADDVLRSRLLARLTIELSFSPQHEQRAALAEEALALARRTGLAEALGPALMARHWSLWRPENLDERLDSATDLLRLARTAGSQKTELQGHRWRMMGLLERGDVAAADLEMEAYAELARRRRQPAELWHVHLYRAMRHLLAGRYGEADEESRTSFDMGREVGEINAHQGYALQRAALLRDRGGLAEVEEAVRAHVARYPSIPGWRCLLAHLLVELGHPDEARAQVDELARDGFARIPRDALWLGAVAHLAEALVSLGDAPRARDLYGLLCPFVDRNVVVAWATTCAGAAARVVALLAATAGDRDAAASHFELALARNRAGGAAPWTARASVEYGRLLLTGGAAVEVSRGRELVHDGLAIAERLGMAPVVEAARPLIEG